MRETGVLLGTEIRDAGIVASNAAEWCYKSASYDLRVGDQYLDPAENINKDSGQVKAVAVGLPGEPIIVPAYSSVVVSSHEILKIPGDVIGKFNLRIRWALKGLFVQMGTQVEPHYHGRLFAVLHNITSSDVVINRKPDSDKEQDGRDRLFTIEFYKIGAMAPNSGKDEIWADMPSFVGKTPFARSAINVMFEKTNSFQNDLVGLKDSVSATITELKAGLVKDAERVLIAAQTQVDAVKSLSDLTDKYHQEAVVRLERKFDEKTKHFEEVEKKVTSDVAELKSSRNEFFYAVGFGAVVVVLASALIPYCVSLAVGWSNPTPDSLLEPIRQQLATVKRDVEGVTSRVDEDSKTKAFEATIATQQEQIKSLVKRLDEMQNPLSNGQAPAATNGQNGGQAQ